MTGGGLFNSVFTGHGKLGLVCEGSPLVIPVTPLSPVYVDTDAIVGWTAGLSTSLHRSQSLGSMLRAAARARRCSWCSKGRGTWWSGRVRRRRTSRSSAEPRRPAAARLDPR